ncbi:hypothetical protein FMGBMHLM_3388 [Methylobacterium aerolatum]|nr:hypothetical protein FMGBMHLM_3388 [Methylobacterium aerolatum]
MRAEEKLAELGPGRAERLRLALEEAWATRVVLSSLAEEAAAADEEALVEALSNVIDRLHHRGAKAPAEDGAE